MFQFLAILLVLGLVFPFAYEPQKIPFTIQDSLEHPKDRFTQGLTWSGSELYESTGLVGQSRIFRMDRKGAVIKTASIPDPHFGEGSSVVGDELLVLTWRSRIGFIFGAQDLGFRGTFQIPGEGWGLCLHQNVLWLSDGSARILKLHPSSREVIGYLDVRDERGMVRNLNELESVGPYILANIWYSDSIIVIDPSTGKVVSYLDLSPVASRIRKANPGSDVLNGIAWDGKRLWITGKLWPRIFALEVPFLSSSSASGIPKKPK